MFDEALLFNRKDEYWINLENGKWGTGQSVTWSFWAPTSLGLYYTISSQEIPENMNFV